MRGLKMYYNELKMFMFFRFMEGIFNKFIILFGQKEN